MVKENERLTESLADVKETLQQTKKSLAIAMTQGMGGDTVNADMMDETKQEDDGPMANSVVERSSENEEQKGNDETEEEKSSGSYAEDSGT